MIKNPTFIFIGYTLDSVIHARETALTGQKVIYLKTGKLGYPNDDIREYISYEDVIKIKTLGIDVPCKKLYNSTYVFVPYDQLKFINTKNGLVSYPLNKTSFESAEEWEQIEYCLSRVSKFRKNLKKATNFINIYKSFFPKWLYDCFLKNMGVNKWGGYRQSKLTRRGLAKEINISCLDGSNTGMIYRPKTGYQKLCELLLDHKNIKTDTITVDELKKLIVKRYKNSEIVLMDNRVDYICNYTHGNFDRVKFKARHFKDPNLEEFIDISEGIVFTPTKDYFCISNEEGKIIEVKSKKIDFLGYKEQSEISPTNYNKKLYNEYKKMLNLYSKKYLNLDNFVVTTVK